MNFTVVITCACIFLDADLLNVFGSSHSGTKGLIEEGHEFHAASGIWIILCQLVFHVSSKLFVKD
jgi:hypothetical protein